MFKILRGVHKFEKFLAARTVNVEKWKWCFTHSCVWFPLASGFSCTQQFEVNRNRGDAIPKNPNPQAFKDKLGHYRICSSKRTCIRR